MHTLADIHVLLDKYCFILSRFNDDCLCVECEPLIVCTVSEPLKGVNMSKSNRFTNDEKQLLEAVFTYNKRPSEIIMQDIADKLAVAEIKVWRWFKYKRFMMKLQAERYTGVQRKLIHTHTR